MYACIFIGNVLDLYVNHLFSNINLLFKSCQIHLFVILLVLLLADYYDLKFGIIPNKLSFSLLIYGLIFNLILSIIFNNPLIILFSIALTALVGFFSFLLWLIGFWGGGDFKIFIGLSMALSFLDLNHINLNYSISQNMSISNQFIFYPKVISILLNAILMASALILMFIFYEMVKNKKIRCYSFLSILNFHLVFRQLTTKSVDIESLAEGMILEEYYFKDKMAYDMINDGWNKDSSNINLKAYEEEDIFYFYSSDKMGLSKEDIWLIKDLYKKDLIKNPNFRIKIGIPFMPFMTLGYIGFMIFGDFISIISSFIRIFF